MDVSKASYFNENKINVPNEAHQKEKNSKQKLSVVKFGVFGLVQLSGVLFVVFRFGVVILVVANFDVVKLSVDIFLVFCFGVVQLGVVKFDVVKFSVVIFVVFFFWCQILCCPVRCC
jgi:hypothetical protein